MFYFRNLYCFYTRKSLRHILANERLSPSYLMFLTNTYLYTLRFTVYIFKLSNDRIYQLVITIL